MAIFMGAAFSPLGAVLCMLTSLVLYLFYRILYAPYHVHKQYGIKGPIPEPFWGSYSDVKKMKINNFIAEGQKKYGSFFGFYIGSRFNVVVCDSLLIEQILEHDNDRLTSGGPYTAWNRLIVDSLSAPSGLMMATKNQWMTCRYALSPIFSPLKIRQIAPVVDDSCTRLAKKMAVAAVSQTTVDVHKLYVEFTMEAMIASAFGVCAESQTSPEGGKLISATNEFINLFLDCMNNGAEEITVLLSHFPRARWLLVRLARRLAVTRAQRRLREAGVRLVAARQKLPSPPQDMLQLLLETFASNDDEDEGADPSDQQVVVGHAIEFLMSGYETTAAALSYVSYQLALHTPVQDHVREEIDAFFTKRPKKSLYDASLRLPYLDSVIQETLRLHPPTPIMIRHCVEDIELERHTLPKGADVYIPTFLVQKSPDHWPHPNKFNPSRFTGEKHMKRGAATHMPFGAGPRTCIGMKFSLTMIKMALIAIIRHYTFVLSPKTEVPLKVGHRLADIPSNGVVLIISPRHSAASTTASTTDT